MTGFPKLNISPFQSDVLDLSRWVAAFLVVAQHLRSLMYADYGDAGGLKSYGGKIFYFFTHFGDFAVMIFFVMSGFLVGGKVLERLAQGNFSWQKYGVDRISRLYAVYLVALLVGGGLDYFGYRYFNQFGLYDQSFQGRISVAIWNYHAALSLPVFAINMVMCQTILGPVFGSNGPLWSLSNEAWYYVLGPLAFILFFYKRTGLRILGIAGVALIVWFLPASILIYGLVWLLGALLYFANHRRLLPIWVSLGLLAASLLVGRLGWVTNAVLQQGLIVLAFALVINSATGSSRRLPANNWSRIAAGFSYSLYLCHFPFLVFAISFLFHEGMISYPAQGTLKYAGVYFILFLMAVVWSYLISLGTERQTPRIRAWLNRGLPKRQELTGGKSTSRPLDIS